LSPVPVHLSLSGVCRPFPPGVKMHTQARNIAADSTI
jgi:hypothetical protein